MLMAHTSKSRGRRQAARLKKLWEADPKCHWCGKPTVLILVPPGVAIGGRVFNAATIDHLRSRLDPNRQEPNSGVDIRTVLACWRCNQQRNDFEQASISVEELRRRAKNGHGSKQNSETVIR